MFRLCMLGGILCGAVLGQGLPAFEQRRNTTCTGDSSSYLASCEAGTVIAVNDIKAGANLELNNCPTNYDSNADPSCCQFKENDCTFRFAEEAYYTWFSGCSGREQCLTPGAQTMLVSADTCGNDYLSIYGHHSQYLLMEYYCIESSILHNVCSATWRSYTGETEFLTSTSYPDDIPSSNTDCTCSVEVDDCDARIQIYTLHLELSETAEECGQQSLTITDGADVQTLTCEDKSFQGISVKETATSYITLHLQNSELIARGRFWLGFRASFSSANVTINCPAMAQKTTCMTTSTSTSTTTSSPKPSTSTTSTTTPTTTTHSVTSPVTTKSTTTPTVTRSTERTSTTTTPTMKAASEKINDTSLTLVIGVMAFVIFVLIMAFIVYYSFERRQLKNIGMLSKSESNSPNGEIPTKSEDNGTNEILKLFQTEEARVQTHRPSYIQNMESYDETPQAEENVTHGDEVNSSKAFQPQQLSLYDLNEIPVPARACPCQMYRDDSAYNKFSLAAESPDSEVLFTAEMKEQMRATEAPIEKIDQGQPPKMGIEMAHPKTNVSDIQETNENALYSVEDSDHT